MRELYEELVAVDERVTRADALVQRVFTQSAACQKLAKIEGVGPVIATVLVPCFTSSLAVYSRPRSPE
jgi:transposase